MPSLTLTASDEVVDTLCLHFGYQTGSKGAFIKGVIKTYLKEAYTAQKVLESETAAQASITQLQAQAMQDAIDAKATAETTADSSIT